MVPSPYERCQRLRAEKAEQALRNMTTARDYLKKALADKEGELNRLLSISEVDRLERELKTVTAGRDAMATSCQRKRDRLKAMTSERNEAQEALKKMTRRHDKALDLYEARGALLDDFSREKKVLVAERNQAQEALVTMTAARDAVSKTLHETREGYKTKTGQRDQLQWLLERERLNHDNTRGCFNRVVVELNEAQEDYKRVRRTVEELYGDLYQARAGLKGKSAALAVVTEELFETCKRTMDAEHYTKTLVKTLDDEVKAHQASLAERDKAWGERDKNGVILNEKVDANKKLRSRLMVAFQERDEARGELKDIAKWFELNKGQLALAQRALQEAQALAKGNHEERITTLEVLTGVPNNKSKG